MPPKTSIRKLLRAIESLPSDRPKYDPKEWFLTQKEHWLGWLKDYHSRGFYGRKPHQGRDARYAYNHIVNPYMIFWLVRASGVRRSLVDCARRALRKRATYAARAGAIRRCVPWEEVEQALWPSSQGASRNGKITRAISIRQPFVEQILRGEKRAEYRSIPTNIRERIYLYASAKPHPNPSLWRSIDRAPGCLPAGAVVGTVEIVGCRWNGRDYAYQLARPRRLRKPLKPRNRPQPVFWKPCFR